MAFEGFVGNSPHVVPWVPAPKLASVGDAVDVVEGEAEAEAEAGEPAATGRADEVLEEV